ncbi:MAG: GatB/YqeY domain-containing protein [Chitinophagales bacterium]
MSLEQLINSDIKTAMLAKDKASLRTLRAIKSQIILAKTAEGASGEMEKATEIKMLSKMVKQRKDSLEIYRTQGRDELAAKEEEEIGVIENYLPKQLSTEELTTVLQKIIADTGASSMRDMGKVMGMASKQFAGKADGKTISTIVKQLLSK